MIRVTSNSRKIRGFNATLQLFLSAAITLAVLCSTNAHALYIDFANYQGSESGHGAELIVGGYSITISSQPTDFDLTISSTGLGVACAGSSRNCRSNSRDQIDAEWNEQIRITFNDGPVVLNEVFYSRLYRGEVATIHTDDYLGSVRGRGRGLGLFGRSGNTRLGMSGIGTTQFVVSTYGRFSDFSLRGIDFDVFESVTGQPEQQPTHPVPEPRAALLFVFGIGIVATRLRR